MSMLGWCCDVVGIVVDSCVGFVVGVDLGRVGVDRVGVDCWVRVVCWCFISTYVFPDFSALLFCLSFILTTNTGAVSSVLANGTMLKVSCHSLFAQNC